MTTLTVGSGEEYSTISAAVAASSSGDTISVDAGTYTNDFLTITHDLTLVANGGTVTMVETEQPPNGKAMIDQGGSGVTVSISGFDISGVSVADGNGAAVRYEGGSLTLDDVNFHDNQEGLLGADDANGSITITNSTFADNGAGDGYTHNIYVGDINSLTVTNSTITSAVVGHDIKSRAENNTITGNTITDGSTGSASYEIDLPNGGNAVISDNTIQKGTGAQNPIAISFGEEGSVYASSSLTVSGNTIVNDDTGASTTAVRNSTSVTASITDNTFYGWTNLSSGAATLSANTVATTEPTIDTTGSTSTTSSGTTTSGSTTSTSSDTGTSTTSGSDTTSTTTGSTTTTTTTSGTDDSGTTSSGTAASAGITSSHVGSSSFEPNSPASWRWSDTSGGSTTGSGHGWQSAADTSSVFVSDHGTHSVMPTHS